MSPEQLVSPEQALDAKWYSQFTELAIEAFALLDGDATVRAAEKSQFLGSETGNPSLGYPKLATFDFSGREESLLELKSNILDIEPNETVRKIYRTKINETLAELRMLQAAKNGDDRTFARYSSFVYGYPDVENTALMSAIVQEKITRGKTDAKRQAAAALRPVLEALVPDIPERHEPLVEVEDRDARAASVEEVVAAFEAALIAVGADEGWSVVADTDSGISNFRVSQKAKTVYLPGHKVVGMLTRDIEAFIQHKVYGHVARRVAGENSRLKLLAVGLDRVEKGEEGVATRLEQLANGADTYSHPERYFAIALARGDVDGLQRDFRGTFEVLKQYYVAVLKGKKEGPTLEERAADWAWGLSVRVFRGTTGNTPGKVFTKDLNYFVGNKETWALVNTDENVVQYFSIGKFDAANPRHVAWLFKLGITDERLQEIQTETFTSKRTSS